MYILGIIDDYDARAKVSERQYAQLEQISRDVISNIDHNGQKRELLEQIVAHEGDVLLLAHLVAVLRHGDQTAYLTEAKTPSWLIDISSNLIQLKAPPEIISERRAKDMTRNRVADIAQIKKHQSLCDVEWSRIEALSLANPSKMCVVENMDLDETAGNVSCIIF
jgi:adenylate kinase